MTNKAMCMLRCMESKQREKIVQEIGEIDEQATPLKQAEYIHLCLETCKRKQMDSKDFMRKCSRYCISEDIIKMAKEFWKQSNNTEEFLDKLNKEGIGGGYLHIDQGKIIGIYKECYCDIPKQGIHINNAYCECSAGWFETLFSKVFQQEVKVTITSTINSGAKECVFEIVSV